MPTISMNSALLALARMMGKRVLPQGQHADWRAYVQTAFEYAWRYYKWNSTLKTVQLVADSNGDVWMPEDYDLDGYIYAEPNANGQVTQLSPGEWLNQGQYGNTFSLSWDISERYKVSLGSVASGGITVTYQAAPPELGDGEIPFIVSPMTIGIGASIYAKQAENPTRADITQEWDEFHKELDRYVAHAERNKPRQAAVNLQDYYGTYTGDVR